jgi:uncharacterized protein YfaS (alpha-2-macroglobulin family)
MNFDKVYGSFNQLGRESQLYMLLAARLQAHLDSALIVEKTKQILSSPTGKTENHPYHAYLMDPAISLLAAGIILEKQGQTIADQLALALQSQMKGDGRFTSTSDTGWALLALGEYYHGMQFPTGGVRGKVIQAGGAEQLFEFKPPLCASLVMDATRFLNSPSVEIQPEGDYSLISQIEARYPRVDYEKEGYARGLKVEKIIENTSGKQEIHLGDVVRVRLVVGVDQANVAHLVVDDPLPAGFVAINSSLASEEPLAQLSEDDYSYYWDSRGFYRLLPNHIEFRDDRVLVFRDWLWKGQFEYSYYARAICVGKFKMSSTKAQLMYDPDTCAYTTDAMLEILK